ncbi:MAG: copA [Chthoniobacteraceae bacterium]|nr:copA [Chthoniobacteraceae bacterium]
MQAVIERALCIHCGTPFKPSTHRPDFCCAGCQFVHDLIARNGFGQFYDLREEAQPVKSLVFQKRDYTWLEEAVRGTGEVTTLTLDAQGLSCIGCAWLIEKLFMRHPGALSIRVDSSLGRLELHWKSDVFKPVVFARELQSFGYAVGLPGKTASPASRTLVPRIGLCAAFALNAMLFTLPGYLGMGAEFQFALLFQRLTLIFGTLSFVVGGSYFCMRSWQSLRRRVLHIDLPISMGLIAAYSGSLYAWMRGAQGFVYFDFVATFTLLMLVGRWLQQKMIERNRNQLLSAQSEPPPVRDAATGERLPVADIRTDAVYLVDPGYIVPVSSRLCSMAATLGLEWISGESDACIARRGRMIPGGAVNCGQASIELHALEPWNDSILAKLLRIAPGTAPRDLQLERFIRGYIVTVLFIAVTGFAGWWIWNGALLPALQVFISVLVVSCPCASGVALPLASDLAASRLRKLGIFIRNSELWARLESVRTVIFDKTGTLTLETISLRNPEVLHNLQADERAVLLSMVHDSLHPVSGCLREQLLVDRVPLLFSILPNEVIGFGLELQHAGSLWRLGRPEWTNSAREGDCIFTRDGKTVAAFRFGEEVRSDAIEEIAALQESGCRVVILSGDRREKVEAMADRLRIPRKQCHAQMSPQEKGEWVQQFDAHDTLYIGDGANDSLAFDAAWCSGTPAVDRGLLEQKADFYFLGRGLGGVRALLRAAGKRRRTVRAVIFFAIAYNVVAVTLCLLGKMNPLLAAILMPASSLVSLGIVFLRAR